ncbi:EIN3-binding F-box protein 1 [Impatiens glandulifera]|uniref:EIN3-binding F-box protein 1 n=1 Tax=Impatiens glandulifera TaxID=253017 RepID=UPI001FB04E8B|nr:EIN3-binding F-box protein 1 [Impatiens glandulifera]
MSKIFDFNGGDDLFCSWGSSTYAKTKESTIYFPPLKRSRVNAPFIFEISKKAESSIDVLPDACLFEIFRRLPGPQERSVCASISKRWLMILSEICATKTTQSAETKRTSIISPCLKDEILKCDDKTGVVYSCGKETEVFVKGDDYCEIDGYLTRNLQGKKATDLRLAAIAVGATGHGGLGKLSVRGSNGVTNVGLKAIAMGCPSLRVLSLWNLSSIGDQGIIEIARGCPQLEKLDLSHCASLSDDSLLAIANSCPNLVSLTIESCPNIGNAGLQAIGNSCPKLSSIEIKNCPLVGDQGITSLLSSSSGNLLTKLKLQGLNVSDISLAVIGHYGKAVTELALVGLQNVTEKGFWVMGKGRGLEKLRSLTISSCSGVTDLGIESMAKGCPDLKQFCLKKSTLFSDNGLVSFGSLESLQLEECHGISQYGFLGLLFKCAEKLKSVSFSNCLGYKDFGIVPPMAKWSSSLRSLSVRNCPGFGDSSLAMLGRTCPQLQNVSISGLHGITDEGLVTVLENNEIGLKKVDLSGCVNLTDKSVSLLTKLHGSTLEVLNLDGCRLVGDSGLEAVAEHCSVLSELDVSKCSITDSGVLALARAVHLSFRILSIFGCSMVSEKSVGPLLTLGENLMGLNVKQCRGISGSGIDAILERLWKCDVLY